MHCPSASRRRRSILISKNRGPRWCLSIELDSQGASVTMNDEPFPSRPNDAFTHRRILDASLTHRQSPWHIVREKRLARHCIRPQCTMYTDHDAYNRKSRSGAEGRQTKRRYISRTELDPNSEYPELETTKLVRARAHSIFAD